MNNQEIQQQINEIVKFTCEYWWPRLIAWGNSPERQFETPLQGAVIRDIIETHGRFVEKLKQDLYSPNQ
jgi:hypothetical protein